MSVNTEQLTTAAFNFDENQFRGDRAGTALLLWLSTAEKAIDQLSEEDLLTSLPTLHKTLSKLLTYIPSTSTGAIILPKPGRPIRHLIARCLIRLHTRVESRTLFEFVQGVMKGVVDGGGMGVKGGGDTVHRVACWYTIGEVMKAMGSNMMSFMSEICVTVIKLLRANSQPVLLRTHSISALTKSLSSAGKAVPDAIAKDLLKYLKNGLGDGAGGVQRCSAEALIALHECTTMISTLSEIENVLGLVIKSLDKADHPTRRSFSRLVAHLLAYTQDPSSALPPTADKKGKKVAGAGNEEQDDPVMIVTSGADNTTKTMLTVQGMLKQLSGAFNRLGTARRARNAVFDIYATLLSRLGGGFAEIHYAEVVDHFVVEILDHPRNRASRHEAHVVREMVGVILREIIAVRLLSEQGQGLAVRELVDRYLKKWPAMLPGQTEPSELALAVVLREVAELLGQLGTASPAIQDAIQDPIFRLLAHPSESIRLHAAWTLRIYCSTTPLKLPRVLNALVDILEKDIAQMGSPAAPEDLAARSRGRAAAIGALMAVIPERPLYVSHDISTRVLDTAVQLLKRSGEHDVKVAAVEVQVAWTLLSGLMTLGPNFVKAQLPQLLVIWRNALPKPTSKDTSVGERGESEWAFLLDVREYTLSAILTFLRNNKELTTLDVARRLTSLLTNTLNFVNGFATAYGEYLKEQQQNPHTTPATLQSFPTLAEKEHCLRRRILQCFAALGDSSATEGVQPALLQAAVGILADPEGGGLSSSAAQVAIQASAGNFTDVWSTSDGYGFGVCSADATGLQRQAMSKRDNLNRDTVEVFLEQLLDKPVISLFEHDYLNVQHRGGREDGFSHAVAVPPQSGVIDAALLLFQEIFAIQNVDTLMQATTLMTNHLRSPKIERNPGRKQAVLYNIVEALRCGLAHGEGLGARKSKDSVANSGVLANIRSLLQDAVVERVEQIRLPATEALGSLAGLVGNTYIGPQIQWLVEQLVQNRVPESRAGCALALANIYDRIGGLSAGSVLKTSVNVLTSLAADPHPIVHYWSTIALSRIVDSASLAYSPFLASTLRVVFETYQSEAHESDGGSLGSANIRGDLPANQATCRLLSALIGVIGPELQIPTPDQQLVLALVNEYGKDSGDGLAVEAIKCTQQLLMFAPGVVEVADLVATFQRYLESGRGPIRLATITALYQIVQRDAVLMSKLGGNRLVEVLFGLLDEDPTIDGVRQIILSWIQQTSANMPAGWISLCQRIINKSTTAPKQESSKSFLDGFQDDEGQSLGAGSSALGATAPARWRTQLFALECVHAVIQAVVTSGRREHFDVIAARQAGIPMELLLVARVADLIRLAFAASTASTSEVRLQGLQVLQDVVVHFAQSPDPDFAGSLLLEQHQAPIAAALTPSFGVDSAPEVLAAAIDVCAVFIGSGIVKEASRMGRILKLLTGALQRCQDENKESVGDVENLSSNAAVMLKLASLTAWAQLRIASRNQKFLVEIVKPHEEMLDRLWIGSLHDYALLRADPETGPGLSSGGMDLASSGFGRETLLPYYRKAAPILLAAVAAAMAANDESILKAFGHKEESQNMNGLSGLVIRPQPLPFFFVAYGLAFETATSALGDPSASEAATGALQAMQSLVKPIYCGSALFTSSVFDELCTLCYRIALGESALLKAEMVRVMAAFAASRGISGDQEQIRRVVAVIAYTLRSVIGSRETPSTFVPSDTVAHRIGLISAGFIAYQEALEALDAGIKFQAFLVGVQLYEDMLRDETSQADLAGPALAVFKSLLDRGSNCAPDSQVYAKVLHSVISAALKNMDEVRGRESAAAVIKTKNNMLLVVLLLTTLPPSMKISQDVVEQACYTIGQRIQLGGEVGLTAVQCSRAVLASANRGNAVLQFGVSQLIPELVGFIAGVAENSESLKPNDPAVAIVDEVIKILAMFVGAFEDSQKTRAYMILVPTLIMLLTPAEPGAVHKLAVNQLLGLAGQSPTSFKEATNTLEPKDRETLETSVRQTIAAQQSSSARPAAVAKPQISLKSFS